MTIPDELRSAIDEAERQLALHRHGALELAQRQRLRAALGPRQAFGIGHRRRTALATFCVRRILPEWERLRPEDDFPHRLLSSAQSYLANHLERRAARALVGQGITHSDNVSYWGWKARDRDMRRVALICHAAAAVLSFASGDDKPSRFEADTSMTDDRLDAYSWDTSYLVALFVARGHPGKAGEDVDRRRAFWRWYIHEAIPMAWSATHDPAYASTGEA
jgi:hypothetical protein